MSERITNCPLCNCSSANIQMTGGGSVYDITCERCRDFSVSLECLSFQGVRERIKSVGHLLSGLSRELNLTSDERLRLTATNIDSYLKHYLMPNENSVEEKANKILQFLRSKTEHFGYKINLKNNELYHIAYAKNAEEFRALLSFLAESGLIKNDAYIGGGVVSLSATGWDLTNNKTLAKTKQAFIAIWFDQSMDENLEAAIEAIRTTGYKPMCIRKEHFAEKIMDKALSEIRKSRFVVVDLTGDRNSVFFEAGFAFGLGIEAIYIYKKGEVAAGSSLEFYVKHFQCYGYDNAADLKDILISAIGARIR